MNGEVVNLDVPAKITNGCTLVPLRFVGEYFGASVQWDSKKKVITIETYTDTEGCILWPNIDMVKGRRKSYGYGG